MIAALYVAKGGCYFGLDDVDPWDEARDARTYDGPHAVVAHPPCQRWGRYWYGGPMLHAQGRRLKKGDDGGCFAAALANVRRWGGVLEHPASSHAWAAFGLATPPHRGGWIIADQCGGWTCHVEQGHYGHRARKATWLYAVRCALPSLRWGPSIMEKHVRQARRAACEREGIAWEIVRHPPPNLPQALRDARRRVLAEIGWVCLERMCKREREATPIPFRDLLLSIARSIHGRATDLGLGH